MGWWVELHCDTKSSGPPEPSRLQPFCFSESSRSPGVLAGDGETAMKALKLKALMAGWKNKRNRGWACPNCAKVVEW